MRCRPNYRWLFMIMAFLYFLSYPRIIHASSKIENTFWKNLYNDNAADGSGSGFLELFNRQEPKRLTYEKTTIPEEGIATAEGREANIFSDMRHQTPQSAGGEEMRQLQVCSDEKWDLRFLCHPKWGVEEIPEALSLIISAEPTVTFSIVKFDKQIKFIHQLNKLHLQDMGQYAPGFEMEQVSLGPYKAVKVKAFSSVYPDMRIVDFFILHDNVLYGFLFSVSPKEAWDSYKGLINKIAHSIVFTNSSPDTADTNNSEP